MEFKIGDTVNILNKELQLILDVCTVKMTNLEYSTNTWVINEIFNINIYRIKGVKGTKFYVHENNLKIDISTLRDNKIDELI